MLYGICCELNPKQSCCPGDEKYPGICCNQELTYCCPPTPNFPWSKCCPRWTICTDSVTSEYGCGYADNYKWNWEDLLAYSRAGLSLPILQTKQTNNVAASNNNNSNNSTIYALFNQVTGLHANIDLTNNGNTINNIAVDFPTYGDMPRKFMYDEDNDLFYFLQANFTIPTTSDGRILNLYVVDAKTGW